MNVLDLGLSTAIQARQYKKHPVIIDERITTIDESYGKLTARTINDVFLPLQVCIGKKY